MVRANKETVVYMHVEVGGWEVGGGSPGGLMPNFMQTSQGLHCYLYVSDVYSCPHFHVILLCAL